MSSHTSYIAQSLTFLSSQAAVRVFTRRFSKNRKQVVPLFLHSGVRRDLQQDLHGHGETGYLRHGVGQRAGRRPQGKQVGDAVQQSTQEENQEVEASHRQRGSDHGVDRSQEEKGNDVFQVVNMSSGRQEGRKEILVTPAHICLVRWLSCDAEFFFPLWWSHSYSKCYGFPHNLKVIGMIKKRIHAVCATPGIL